MKFQLMETITARIDPSTVAKELAPQAQPIMALSASPSRRIPSGKNAPMKNPASEMRTKDEAIRKGNGKKIEISTEDSELGSVNESIEMEEAIKELPELEEIILFLMSLSVAVSLYMTE